MAVPVVEPELAVATVRVMKLVAFVVDALIEVPMVEPALASVAATAVAPNAESIAAKPDAATEAAKPLAPGCC
jgi:hypothetical protein